MISSAMSSRMERLRTFPWPYLCTQHHVISSAPVTGKKTAVSDRYRAVSGKGKIVCHETTF